MSTTRLVEVFLKSLSRLDPLPLLYVHHDTKCLPGLVWPELVEEMVDVDEEEAKVLHFLGSSRGLGALD